MGERGRPCGRGGGERRRRRLSGTRRRARERRGEGYGEEIRESERVRGAAWRREGVGEAATAKQEVAGVGARASRLCLLAEEEEDKGGGGLGLTGGLHRGGWASTGERQVIPVSSLYFSVFLFPVVCFNLV